MSEPEDPERLLAEALRAQAVRAPQPVRLSEQPTDPHPIPVPEPVTTELEKPAYPAPAGYGLLSGTEAGTLERERAALESSVPATGSVPAVAQTRQTPQAAQSVQAAQALAAPPVGVGWVLMLALLLGLAAGAVAGLLTLI